jgi:2-polyprenyl-3-methyl-5-hydroxy-6-metoxy-1,4-benzoquinol methylase
LSTPTKDKWNKHYHSCEDEYPEAAEVLFQNQHLLPTQGTALDLACGRGANALCLAENGLTVSAWDISSSALEQLSLHANKKHLTINTEVRDISTQTPEANTFDVIVVSRFLDRTLMNDIKRAIKVNGLIFYQTFTKEKISESGPNNPDYLLDKNELLNFFIDWEIICYREEGKTGNIDLGFRNQAMLIAQKP